MMRRIIGLALALMMTASLAHAQKPAGYTLEKGDVFTMTTVAKQDIQQEAMGQSITTEQTISNTDELEVTGVNGDVYTIKITAIRRAASVQSPMGPTEIDSDMEGDMHTPFRILSGKSYSVEMNNMGKVLRVIGVEEMKKTMTQEMTDAGMGAAADQMLIGYSSEMLKSGLNTQLAFYEGNNGSEWTSKVSSVINNLPVELENSYKWDGDVTILAEAKVDMNGTIEAMGASVKTAMKGDQQTIIDLDAKSGMPTKIQTIQAVDGNLETQGMTIPMTIVSETTTTIVKK